MTHKPQTKIIQQGAEAIIYLKEEKVEKSVKKNDDKKSSLGVGRAGKTQLIIKDRISKSYRHPELDKTIRKRRTKAETKLLLKASEIISSPKPLTSEEFNKIKMPFINGKKLSEHLDNFSLKKQEQICRQIGESIAKLHNKDLIHGDLTTSNMILSENNKQKSEEFKKKLDELKKLNLPTEKYAIFGSGPLAIRGIRNSRDIDVIVKKDLWNKLTKNWSLTNTNNKFIRVGEIEIYKDWEPWFKDINKLIDNAEVFDNIRFVKLEDVLNWKKASGREKDKKDIKLIEKYQTKKDFQVFFIDFGLGFISKKIEDKAVDLHLLRQALEARHFQHWQALFKKVLQGYAHYKEHKKVLEQLKKVEKRGRYKH